MVRERLLVSLLSARPDGATTQATGLAARLSASGSTLLVDLCLERPEIATLLDLDETPGVLHLASRARLGAPTAEDLRTHVRWVDGLAVLPGIGHPSESAEIGEGFVDGLVARATELFDNVVIDLGRPREALPSSVMSGALAWVVAPSPLGLAALEKTHARLQASSCLWVRSRQLGIVLNHVSPVSFGDIDGFLRSEYGLPVTAEVPFIPAFWRAVETRHSARALCAPPGNQLRMRRAYGSDAVLARHAMDDLAGGIRRALHRGAVCEPTGA